MKKIEEITQLVQDYISGGDSISTAASLPPVGKELTLDKIEGRTFGDRATQADVDSGLAKEIGEELPGDGHQHKFLAGEFKPSGTLSLATLLRSPELTWDENLDTKTKRIDALQHVTVMFFSKEVAKSKSGRTYNIYHMRPQTIGVPSKSNKS